MTDQLPGRDRVAQALDVAEPSVHGADDLDENEVGQQTDERPQTDLNLEDLLDDPGYIHGVGQGRRPVNSNVAPLSVNVVASLLAQYVSFSVAPSGLGDPGALQYVLSTHHLERRNDTTSPHCPVETAEAVGDGRVCLTGVHEDAERKRHLSLAVGAHTRLLRWLDDRAVWVTRWLDRR